MGRTDRQADSITATRMLRWFLCAIAGTIDRDGMLILRDPVLEAEVHVPARLLLRLCAATCRVAR